MPQTFTDVACTVCGCVCDDLRVTVEGGRVVAAEGACRLAEPWFAAVGTAQPPVAEVGGNAVSLGAAYARAADQLKGAKYPLIYGLGRSTSDGLRAAVALADRLGATVDTAGPHAATVAMQAVGESTCTLGEVRQRADLVVFWGCDPLVTHPRFVERYCPPRSGRTLVVVDTEETETAKAADAFVPVTPGRQWEAVTEVRQRGLGEPGPQGPRVQGPVEVTPARLAAGARLEGLLPLLRSAAFGVVVFGDRLTSEPLAHRTVEALLQLVTDLNRTTRCYAVRLTGSAEVSGADSLLAWQTGYPFGVNFAAGYPRYNPGEFTGAEMLARGEPDLCVLVGSEGVDLSPDHLRRIPVIALDPPGVKLGFAPAVRFTTAVYGVHRPGTARRLDGVTLPLRTLCESEYPSDGEVLGELLRRVP